MSTQAAARRKKKDLAAAAATAPAYTLGRGACLAPTALSLGRGGGSAPTARSLGRGGGSAAIATRTITGGIGKGSATAPSSIDGFSGRDGFPSSSSSMDGFLFPPSPSSSWWDAASGDPSSPGFGRSAIWDGSWDKDSRPPGGYMSYFSNQPHNFHFVGAPIHSSPSDIPVSNNEENSSPEVEIFLEQPYNNNDNIRTERRILWTEDEDIRLMSAWIEHSTDSTCGADKGGKEYWGEVFEAYNKTTPPPRKRNLKQCKDRWHKINRMTDLFECAYIKARRVFTSGYNDQMWIDAAHKFYVADNKDAKLGPFVLIEVWKICREVAKWKAYNEELKNACKRKSFHLEEEKEENEESLEEMPKRPPGQKAAKEAAKMAALAAKGKSKGSSSNDDGNSKESAIDLDKLDRFSKFQEQTNANRMKILELQQKLSSEKKLAHLTAQETKEGKKFDKESKMMEVYNNLITQDTSSMSDAEKVERVDAMKCLRKALFPETI